MKKKIKIPLILSTLALATIPTVLLTSCSNNPSSNNTDDEYNKPIQTPNDPEILDKTNTINPDTFSIGTFESKVIKTHKRKVQEKIYDSEVYKQYAESHNFRYPTQDYNYEVNNQNLFTNKNNQSDVIDGMDVVFNEKVTNEQGQYIDENYNVVSKDKAVRYSHGDWIQNEIYNGNFKKHRAADGMFLNNIKNIDSVTKEFTVSTATGGNLTLGLYAPPGEEITITFDDETWDIIKNDKGAVSFIINQNMWDNKQKGDSGQISNRYPFIETGFSRQIFRDKTFKIGSPFGGSISMTINSTLFKKGNIPLLQKAEDIKFTIDGAIPCVFYQFGITSEKDWKQQIKDVTQQKLAPVIQANSAYFSLAIPFNGHNIVGGKKVEDLIYPLESFKKWNDFLYLSNYYAGRDINRELKRLNMEYCDDIWGGAAAWGGGMNFYCPTEWGVNAMFFSPPDKVFNAGNSWGVFHEINHNFEQNSAFFRKNTHGETNQVTAFNLSVLSDITRYRNETNWTGERLENNLDEGWTRLDTAFSVIKMLHRWDSGRPPGQLTITNEYEIYSLLLFLLGSKNYVEYLRKDVREHPSNVSTWTGLSEIIRLSDSFKVDMWPAFKDYSQYWCDWIRSESEASPQELAEINRIKKYKAIDFVANEYASGSYLFNSETNQHEYTGDILPAFQIPPFQSYTFDFENMIISTNKDFVWDKLEFSPKTKLGSTLKLDPQNPKKLIYKPAPGSEKDIDEFDVSIIPGKWNNKPSNYVSSYKYKIKVRQEMNSATLETYPDLTSNKEPSKLFEEMNNRAPEYRVASKIDTPYFPKEGTDGIKFKFKLLAKESGEYKLKAKWDDLVKVFINGELKFEENYWTPEHKEVYKTHLNKGETIDIEFQVINTSGKGGFHPEVYFNDKKLNMDENILSINIPVSYTNDYLELLIDPKYKYKPREIDYQLFDKSLTAVHNLSNYSIENSLIQPTEYKISSPNVNNAHDLNSYNDNVNEVWSGDEITLEYNFEFNDYKQVESLYVAGRTNNWTNARPKTVEVYGYKEEDSLTPITMYSGLYGVQYNDRFHDITKINLTRPATVKRIKVIFKTNEIIAGNDRCISLKWIRIGSKKYANLSNSFGFNNPLMDMSKNWIYRRNDELNSSALNGLYVMSPKTKNRIRFTLNNAQGFSIIGKLNGTKNNTNASTKFTVFVNGTKFEVDLNSNKQDVYNSELFTYIQDTSASMNIEIITDANTPLYLNYLMTFSENATYLS